MTAFVPQISITVYRTAAARWLLLLLLSCGMPVQADVFLSFVDPNQVSVAVPAFAADAQAIHLDLEALASVEVEPGAALLVEIAAAQFQSLQITALTTYINGDRMIRAQGRDSAGLYSLSLTVGPGHLYGHFGNQQGTRQIYALKQDGGYFGWQYRPQGLSSDAATLQNDYLIPNSSKLSKPVDTGDLRLPLQISKPQSTTQPSAAAATNSGINANNFKITQTFDRTSVLVGSTVTAQLKFKNIGATSHTDLYVEVFFLLENSDLLTASSGCRQQLSLSLQKVLYCELGKFAPGEEKQVSYQIAILEKSKPLVISTPVVGNLRLDSFINVVADVRSDSDGDGVSDYNEALVGTDPQNAASVDHSDTVIDVMAFYTPGAKAAYPFGVETRINQLISVANQVYADSGVAISLRPVYHGEVNYTDSGDMDAALDAIIYKTDPAFGNVDKLREMYGGDLVMLFRPLGAEVSRCGLAPVGGFNTSGDLSAPTEKQFAYAHIGIDCPADIVVAHELGHTMGLTHSHQEDGGGGTFNFSTGYGVEGQFATVMAMPAAFNAEIRIPQFSNPRLDCLGFVCGVEADQPFGADAALSLNITKHQIANYYPTRVPDLPRNSVTTLSGSSTTARIAIAATYNHGLSYDSLVTPGDIVDVLADIAVDDTHVGKSGNIYVLISLQDGQIYQLNRTGTFQRWDGTAEGLVAVIANKPLNKLQRLNLLDGFQFGEAFIGQEFNVYIAYEVIDIGEFVYTTTPLVIRVEAAQ